LKEKNHLHNAALDKKEEEDNAKKVQVDKAAADKEAESKAAADQKAEE
jgi:hypothetical protein